MPEAVRQQQTAKIKIGVSIWSSTDVLGSQCKTIIDEAAEALGDVKYSTLIRAMYQKRLQHLLNSCAAGCQG